MKDPAAAQRTKWRHYFAQVLNGSEGEIELARPLPRGELTDPGLEAIGQNLANATGLPVDRIQILVWAR